MKESSTYQAILEEGRQEGLTAGRVAEAKKVLRLLGDDAFGPPDAQTAASIERMEDLPILEELLKQLRSAASWSELLSRPTASGRRRRRPAP